jgi:transcriptional regulator with XRE-family HTH domain
MPAKNTGIEKIMTSDEIREMACGGMSRQQVADYYGITVRRLNQIFKQRNDLLAAFNTGLAQGIKVATRELMNRIQEGNIIATIFYLKARGGWIEQQYIKQKPETDAPKVQIYLPDNGRDSVGTTAE